MDQERYSIIFSSATGNTKLLARMMSVVLQRQIAAGSLQYCLCALAASAAVTFVLAVLKKNIQISVEFQNE